MWRAARLPVATLVVGAFLLGLLTQADSLREHTWRLAPGYLAIAALVALGRGPSLVYPWWRIVSSWGYPLAWGRAMRLYFHSGLARYIPGQWWFVPLRVHLAEQEGIRRAASAASTAIETVLLTGSALSIAMLGGATVLKLSGYAPYLLAIGTGVAIALVASPAPIEWLSNRALKLAGREALPVRLALTDMLLALLGCWTNWLMYGLVAVFLLAGLSGGEHLDQAVGVVAIFAASVLGGSLALLVPQGLVVREGVLVYLLNALLGVPIPVGIGVAGLTRLYAMGAEGFWALACLRRR